MITARDNERVSMTSQLSDCDVTEPDPELCVSDVIGSIESRVSGERHT